MNVPVLSLHSTFNGGKWLVVLEAQINASIKGQAYLLDLHLAMIFVSLYVLTSPLVYLVQNRNSKVWMDQLLDFTCSWGLGEELSFYWLQSCLIYVKIIILLSSKKSFCIQNRTTAKYNVMLFPQRAFGFGGFLPCHYSPSIQVLINEIHSFSSDGWTTWTFPFICRKIFVLSKEPKWRW